MSCNALPTIHLHTGSAEDIVKHPTVIAKATLPEFIWVHVSMTVCACYELISIREVDTDNQIDINSVKPESGSSRWLRIPTGSLNMSIGLHTYILEFVDSCTDTIVQQQFNYILQETDPDKPYVYMKR